MRTRKTPPASSSAEAIHLTLPTSWTELTEAQLRRVLFCMATFPPTEARAHAFVHLAGLTVVRRSVRLRNTPEAAPWLLRRADGTTFPLTAGQLLAITDAHLAWMGELPAVPVRLPAIRSRADGSVSHAAIDAALHGLPFGHYLQAENLYQSHLAQIAAHASAAAESAPSGFAAGESPALAAMAPLLYPGSTPDDPDPEELTGIFLWWAAAKQLLARAFPHFLRPADAPEGRQPTADDLRRSMDAQIRALTDGDITREQQILNADTWRAFTELDAKARDAEQLRKASRKAE